MTLLSAAVLTALALQTGSAAATAPTPVSTGPREAPTSLVEYWNQPADPAAIVDAGEPPTSLVEMLRRPAKAANKAAAASSRATSTTARTAPASARPAPRTGLKATIARIAAQHGVPPSLAEAVVHVESRFNPRARGAAGEVGLMQIKPATARAIGYRGSVKGLYDPETNLAWGMRYLATAYRLAGGDTCGAILRYNGGHAARRMTGQVRAYCGKVDRYVASL